MRKERLLVMIFIMLLLTGCGGNESAHESSDMEESIENENEEENNNGIFIDSAYATYRLQVPTEQIISDHSDYDKLTLLSHVVEEKADSTIAASDLVEMCGEIRGKYYTIQRYFSRMYWYWGEELGLGWQPNVTIDHSCIADISGFSNTYWKIPIGGESNYYARMFDIENIDYEKDYDVYFHFGDITQTTKTLKIKSTNNELDLYALMTNGEMVLRDGDRIIKMPLELQQDIYYPSVYLGLDGIVHFKIYAPTTDKKENVCYIQEYEDGKDGRYNSIIGSTLQAVTEEEYKNLLDGDNLIDMVPTDSGENNNVNEISGTMPDNIYGTYSFDSGKGAVVKAEVSVATGTGEDYIYLGALYSDSNHYSNEILGTLVHVSDNVYYVKDECYGIAEAEITFTNGGMKVEIINTDTDKYDILEGQYIMTSEIDWSQVG